MRYFLLGVAVLFFAQAWAVENEAEGYSEAVSAISFNPSRTGAYSHLKIVHKATLAGIDATTPPSEGSEAQKPVVNLASTGAIEVVSGCQPGSEGCVPAMEIKTVQPIGTQKNTQLETKPGSLVCGENCTSTSFPPSKQLQADENAYAAQGIDMLIKGGTLSSGGNANAFVKQLVATIPVTLAVLGAEGGNAALDLGTARINITNSITLGGAKIQLSNLYDIGSNNVFCWDSVSGYSVVTYETKTSSCSKAQ